MPSEPSGLRLQEMNLAPRRKSRQQLPKAAPARRWTPRRIVVLILALPVIVLFLMWAMQLDVLLRLNEGQVTGWMTLSVPSRRLSVPEEAPPAYPVTAIIIDPVEGDSVDPLWFTLCTPR